MKYRRAYQAGASYFFTVVTKRRATIFDTPENVAYLSEAFGHIRNNHPFELDAIVVMPDHLHCIWTMPEHDADFSKRWRLIKTRFVQKSGITDAWQPRFWEHLIRDQRDYDQHFDYIHFTPVKHGCVQQTGDWPYSSFRKFVVEGFYPEGWGISVPDFDKGVGVE